MLSRLPRPRRGALPLYPVRKPGRRLLSAELGAALVGGALLVGCGTGAFEPRDEASSFRPSTEAVDSGTQLPLQQQPETPDAGQVTADAGNDAGAQYAPDASDFFAGGARAPGPDGGWPYP